LSTPIATLDNPLATLLAPILSPGPPAAARPASIGLRDVPAAVARGIRMLVNSPREGLLVLTGWALLASPLILARRRRLLREVTGP
jgi:hypothetical protein